MLVITLCALCLSWTAAPVSSEGVKIESQLAAVTSDCYDRIAIGQRLRETDILRTISTQLVKECEKECDLDLEKCDAFSFGISSKGNGSCELSPKRPPKSATLKEDPDYDVYVKREECRFVSIPSPGTDHEYQPQHHHASACFRRLLIGKKLAEHHIRRSLPTRSSHTCEEECANEQNFVCEGFNYRLDTGSCELTEVPISRLDLGHDFYPDRDYDYYERDRNSGPECGAGPSQGGLYGGTHPYGPWGGDPGWGGARPPSSGTVGWYGSGGSQGPTGWYGSGGSQGPTGWYGSGGSQRPIEWHGSGGSQRPTEWHGGGGSQRPTDWHGSGGSQRPTDWYGSGGSQGATGWYGSGGSQGATGWYGSGGSQGPTGWYGSGGSYGGGQTSWGSYGRPQGSPGPWNRPPSGGGGGWGDGGGGGGGSEVGFHKPPPPALPPPPPSHTEECFLRVRTGFRLDRRVVQLAIATPSLHDCEEECARQGHCNSFSFRYSLDRRFPNENCYMSERYQQDLDPYTELVPDRNYDIYVKNERACSSPAPPFPVAPDSECFIRVRSGQRLDQSVIKDSLEALSIGECELACLNARYFTCRVFSYRYGPPVIGAPLENCQLTDWPFLELDPRRQFIEDIGYELYERGSYGHGCEVNRLPPPDDRHPLTRPLAKPSDEICYVGYGIPAQLLESAVRSSLDVPTEQECKKECSRARDSFLFFCTSLSFRTGPAPLRHPHSDSEPQHNCLLSDIDQRDLRPGLDYEHDQDTWLFAWDSLNARCDLGNAPGGWTSGGGGEGMWSSGGPAGLGGPGGPGHGGPGGPGNGGPGGPGHGGPGGLGNGGPGGPGNGGWDLGGGAWGSGGGRPPPHYIPGRWDVPTWQRFTVSGRPCRYGTECQENREAGFWSCELEGGDAGAWDYCCRPGHQCGYSEGFNYPWCYVGNALRDQWRPCSDQYYPYPQEPHPHHTGGADLPYSYEGYGPPRYWPVAYLHREVPPNASRPDPFLQQNLDGGAIENYVDSQRAGYGKQLLIFPLNATSSKFNNQLPKQNTVKGTDKKNSADDVLVLEVVDAKDENTEKEEQISTTVSPKLQPRFASTQKRGLVARDVGHPGWSWRGTTASPRVVEFRRRDNSSTVPRTMPTKI